MPKFAVTVRRVCREDAVVEVEAGNAADAMEKARLEAPDSNGWDCYDCEYHTDLSDVKTVEAPKSLNLYSINVKLAATAYIKAANEDDAKRILLERIGETPGFDGEDDVRDAIEDDQFQAPELSGFSLSPAMTYHGVWDGEFDFELAADDVPPPPEEE